MAVKITIANQKGGLGKTVTAISLATGLKNRGFKTLLIDADPQCNSTDTYRAKVENQATLYDLLHREANVKEVVQNTDLGDIIAGDKLLRTADTDFMKIKTGRDYILKEQLAEIENDYDFIIMDNNPALGLLLIMTMTVADFIIIPLTADRYSLQGINELRETIEGTRKYTNPNLKVMGILITIFEGNTSIAKQLLDAIPVIEKPLQAKIFETKIRKNVTIKDSTQARTSIFDFDDKSNGAEDYNKLIDEILNLLEMGK